MKLRTHKQSALKQVMLAALGIVALQGAVQAAPWKTFAPKDGGFSVLLPGNPPVKKTVEKDKDDGSITTNWDWSLETATTYYTIGTQEHPAQAARLINGDGLLDETVKTLPSEVNGKLIGQKKIKSNNFPGRQLKIETGDGVIVEAKLFWAKRRLYMLMAGYAKSGSSADAAKFINSFKLLAQK